AMFVVDEAGAGTETHRSREGLAGFDEEIRPPGAIDPRLVFDVTDRGELGAKLALSGRSMIEELVLSRARNQASHAADPGSVAPGVRNEERQALRARSELREERPPI